MSRIFVFDTILPGQKRAFTEDSAGKLERTNMQQASQIPSTRHAILHRVFVIMTAEAHEMLDGPRALVIGGETIWIRPSTPDAKRTIGQLRETERGWSMKEPDGGEHTLYTTFPSSWDDSLVAYIQRLDRLRVGALQSFHVDFREGVDNHTVRIGFDLEIV